ncbi:EamA-like transporter family protein [Roseovarius albus]|uniref:EamA-like transporter family protein n=1 Tax=Roseovarius albus TaxID=1247867 RepID=A0A1X6YE10_9RHOB|nr:DMT family transporter [Roseovarius albus]SLN18696.1 EamA-like transporter family protein [Roseovarius albus]
MNEHLKGLIITTLGVLFVVPDSLFVRLIQAEPMVTAFWRGLSSGGLILIGLLLFQKGKGFGPVLRAGWPAVIYIALIGFTTAGFVLAIENTSVANVVFIFATMPIFAAIFERVFLKQSVSLRMTITMIFVIFGMGIIAYGSTESEIASWKGDLWALSVSAAYAAALTAVRSLKDISMIPAIPIAYIGAAFILAFFTSPMEAAQTQWGLILAHGTFIAIATCFLTLGPRYISTAEVSLLILLESVLAPLLVWAVLNENPGTWALAGGTVVIGALIVSNLVVMLRPRSTKRVKN